MEPTQIKRPEQGSPIPVPAARAAMDAHRRAPTLMAGEAAGGQGTVRVWSPSKEGLREAVVKGPAINVLVMSVLSTPAWFVSHELFPVLVQVLPYLIALVLVLLVAAATARRPSFITTDDSGIGLTLWTTTVALRWTDIQAVELRQHAVLYPHLRISGPRSFTVNLFGYPSAVQNELFIHIAGRAGLDIQPRDESLRSLLMAPFSRQYKRVATRPALSGPVSSRSSVLPCPTEDQDGKELMF